MNRQQRIKIYKYKKEYKYNRGYYIRLSLIGFTLGLAIASLFI